MTVLEVAQNYTLPMRINFKYDRNFYILEISASPEKHLIILESERGMEHGMGITHGMGWDLEFTDSKL